MGVTGHRPHKLAPKPACYSDETLKQLIKLAYRHLKKLQPKQVVTGMALGWDMAIAIAALKLDIPVMAAVPFKGQESKWPLISQKRYRLILEKIKDNDGHVVIVSSGGYTADKMLKRDKFIVKNSDLILALWNGSSGGTAHTISIAKRAGRLIINAWFDWENR